MHNSVALVSAVHMSHWINFRCTSVQFSSVQTLSCVRFFVTPWIAARQASLSIINSRSSLRLTSVESVMPSSHLILCHPLLLLPPIPPSIRVFSNESTLRMRWPKYWSFNFSIIPSKDIPGLISFRMDWMDILAVQGTLKSLLQHHSSKASILWHSAFFTDQLSHPYIHPVNFGFPSHLCHKSSQVPFFFYFSQNMVVFKIYLGVNYNTILWWFLSSNINKP